MVLMNNIVSISQLRDNDYDVVFNQKFCKVIIQNNVYFSLMGQEKITKLNYFIFKKKERWKVMC